MHIDRNAALTNLDALSSIRVLGDMSVTENVVLVSLDGLAALESVSGYCSVSKNAALCQNSVVAPFVGAACAGSDAVITSGNNESC